MHPPELRWTPKYANPGIMLRRTIIPPISASR
jgi:hypothetical protein